MQDAPSAEDICGPHLYCKVFRTCTNREKSFLSLVVPRGLLARSRVQNSARDWCMSGIFCNAYLVPNIQPEALSSAFDALDCDTVP